MIKYSAAEMLLLLAQLQAAVENQTLQELHLHVNVCSEGCCFRTDISILEKI